MIGRRKLYLIFVGSVTFLLGRIFSTGLWTTLQQSQGLDAIENFNFNASLFRANISSSENLSRQIADQRDFQDILEARQNPQHCFSRQTRYLVRDKIPPKDGFASEIQYIARLLQVALSTERILLISDNWRSAYCPINERLDTTSNAQSPASFGWTCLWQPISICTPSSSTKDKGPTSENQTLLATTLNSMTHGIHSKRRRSAKVSPWFHAMLYSKIKAPVAPVSFPLKHTTIMADVIPHWERKYGRYWIRSQMVHFLWTRQSQWLREEIDKRLSYPVGKPFIGIHVRFTDNVPDLAQSFGRNATCTRDLHHYWKTINHIVTTQAEGKSVRDIYLATDHTQVISWAKTEFQGWRVWSQDDVQRSKTQDRIWFGKGRSAGAGAMAADLEALRRADFLIGSFQSNVYRLASELNTAWHVGRYSQRARRHYTVDVEWFEDP